MRSVRNDALFLNKVKNALRVKTDVFDCEIEELIAACKSDLTLSGVKKFLKTDPIILRAAILYAKANFGYNEDSEKYQRSYNMLKDSLSLAGDYNGRK